MAISLLICIIVSGLSYALLSKDKSIINISIVALIYGFVSFIIYLLLSTRYQDSIYVNELLITIIYMVVMYNSDLTKLLTQKRNRSEQ